MRVAILGSGFGLYGYLPALVGCGARVILPRRYEASLRERNDVRHLLDAVAWAEDERTALDKAEAAVIAQRPDDQARWIPDLIGRPGLDAILLEKPVAPDPERSADVVERVEGTGRRLRVGYTLRYATWAQRFLGELRTSAHGAGEIEIVWRFRAHHYATRALNWKRFVSSGGGALRFYGIHLIALLAEAGYTNAQSSRTSSATFDEAETWDAVITAPGLPRCTLSVSSNSSERVFAVRSSPEVGIDVDLTDPFDEIERHGTFDRRVDVLARLCRDLIHGEAPTYSWYREANVLWGMIEARNEVSTSEAASI